VTEPPPKGDPFTGGPSSFGNNRLGDNAVNGTWGYAPGELVPETVHWGAHRF
jgi:hypothetical protein